jgi:hypothetical protein
MKSVQSNIIHVGFTYRVKEDSLASPYQSSLEERLVLSPQLKRVLKY